VRLVGALGAFWRQQATLIEAWSWLERSLERSHTTSILARTNFLRGAQWVAFAVGDYVRALAFGEQALAFARQIGDNVVVASVLLSIAITARNLSYHEQSQVAAEEALGLFQQIEVSWGVSGALLALGDIMYDQGNNAKAAALFEEALALARQHSSQLIISIALITLARVAHVEENYARAMELYQESLAAHVGRKDPSGYYLALQEMGKVALDQGDHGQAVALFQQCIIDNKEIKWLTFSCLEGLAAVAMAQNDGERAARLWGAVETARAATGVPIAAYEARDYDRWQVAAHAQFDEAAFAAAWAAGRAMSLDQAIAEAFSSGAV
jgi:tetratricopeptide (TPR) repeat protein